MKHTGLLAIAVIIYGCSTPPTTNLVRTDLFGETLTTDDFAVILGDRLVKTFYTKTEVGQTFPGIGGTKKDTWQWSVLLPNSKGDEKTTEYQTNQIRIVFFEHEKSEFSSYLGLKNEATTIRGIRVGSSLAKVVDNYGKTDWLEQHKESLTRGDAGLVYRFYNYPDSASSKYPFYDYIYFEARDGVVVGIHFWRKQSDAE